MYIKIIIIYIIFILTLHIISTPTGSNGVALSDTEIAKIRADYLLHTLVFLPWMVLVWLYLNSNNIRGRERRNRTIIWICAGVFLSVFAEGIQYWLPYRGFNVIDIAFNISGVLLGGVIFLYKPGGQRYKAVNDAPK